MWDTADEQLLAQLAGRAAAKGLSLAGEGGFLQQMTRLVLQAGLEAEMTAHLGRGAVRVLWQGVDCRVPGRVVLTTVTA